MQIDPAKLVEARLARVMSQEEVAIAADLSSRTIQRIEAGHVASLESTKALLTVFGADIIYDPAAAVPQDFASPWRSLASQIAHGVHIAASYGFDGLRLFFAAVFVLVAAAKPLVPDQTGLFIRGDSYALGWLSRPPAGSQEVLGYWIMPLMFAVAVAAIVSVGRVRQLVESWNVRNL